MRDGSSCFDVDYDMPDYYLFKCWDIRCSPVFMWKVFIIDSVYVLWNLHFDCCVH